MRQADAGAIHGARENGRGYDRFQMICPLIRNSAILVVMLAAPLATVGMMSKGSIAAEPKAKLAQSSATPAATDTPATAAETKSATGKQFYGVVTSSKGKPLEGALVWVRPSPHARKKGQAREDLPANFGSRSFVYETTTDEKGQFSVVVGVETDYDRDRWDLVARAPGFSHQFLSELEPGAHAIELAPSRRLRLTLTSHVEGDPLVGADVYACGQESGRFGLEVCRAYKTDEAGQVEEVEVGSIDARLYAYAPRHAVGRIDLPNHDRPGEPPAALPDQRLSLRPGFDVWGRCLVSGGKPAVDASVTVGSIPKKGARHRMENNYPITWRGYCDDDGRYRIVGLNLAARHLLYFRKAGYMMDQTEPLEPETGKFEVELDVTLVRGAKVRITLIGPDEEPFVGEVRYRYEDVESNQGYRNLVKVNPRRVSIDDNQVTTIDELPVKTLAWVVSPVGYQDIQIEQVQMIAEEVVDLGVFSVQEGREASGWVLDQDENPVEGAVVTANYGDSEQGYLSREAKSSSSGEFRIGGLSDSRLQLSAKKEGFAPSASRRLAKPEQELELKLEKTFGVKGSVLGLDGNAIPTFMLISSKENVSRRARSDNSRANISQENGGFVHEGLVPGIYTFRFVAEGTRPYRMEGVEISDEELLDLGEIQLEKGEILSGRVIQSEDETPVVGALVTALSVAESGGSRAAVLSRWGASESLHQASTDQDGRFEINNLGSGSHSVSANFADYPSATERVEIERGIAADVELVLEQGGTLTGVVRKNGEPVPNSTVMLYSEGNLSAGKDARTDSQGRYRMVGLHAGLWKGIYSTPDRGRGLNFQPKDVQIRAGEESVLDFGDEEQILVRGTVRVGEEPVAAARLTFVKGNGTVASRGIGGTSSTQSNDVGEYEVAVSSPGTYTAMVSEGMLLLGSKTIVVPDQEEVEQDLVFDGATLSGRIVNSNGQAVGEASIVARESQASATDFSSIRMAKSGLDGSYSIVGVQEGSYTVAVDHEDYRPASREGVQVPAAGNVESIDFELETGRKVQGRVVDLSGTPVVDASVFMVASGTGVMAMQNSMAVTNVAGQFDIQLPTDDPVDMGIWAAGWAPQFVRAFQPGSGNREPIQVILTPGGSAGIRLRGPDNEPLPHTQIRIAPAFSAPMAEILMRPIVSDETGYGVAENLAPGAYTVSVAGQNSIQRIEVIEGQRTEIELAVAGTVSRPN